MRPSLFFQLALLFSWIGDLFYIFKDQDVFVKLTVVSYFFTQVFLILELRKFIKHFNGRYFSMGILLFACYLTIFLNRVYTYLDDMKIYAIVYGLTISYLGCLSLMYFFQKQSRHRFFFFLGVLFYSFRDVLLTYNVKVFKHEFFTFSIALFYVIALILITRFLINELALENKHD